jgi:hypothetical protein
VYPSGSATLAYGSPGACSPRSSTRPPACSARRTASPTAPRRCRPGGSRRAARRRLPGPGAFLIGRGRVQRQRVARFLWLPAGKTVMQAIAQFTPEDRHTFERLLNQIADHLEHAVHPPSQAGSH